MRLIAAQSVRVQVIRKSRRGSNWPLLVKVRRAANRGRPQARGVNAVTEFVSTSELELAYEVSGPQDGAAVVAVHGWPDDPHTWDGLLDGLHGEGLLTETGYRRYGMHDLIRRYVADRAVADPPAASATAVGRLQDFSRGAA